jgi:hydrogenase maturation factor
VDGSGRWTKVWAPWIKLLLQTVRGTAAAVETINVTIDQVQGAYTINRNVNGRIVGQVKLDGTDASTNFAVLADKFIIVHPAADGTEIQAFITGLVNGVATVGINGNLFVDGTILARSLAVSQLSAITANIGTITAGVLQSADGKMVIDLNNKTLTITT